MIHARIDVVILNHRRAFEVGIDGMGLWLFAVTYAREQETDGFIPSSILLAAWGSKRNAFVAEKLVKAGLLEFTEGGYVVRNYAAKNETKAQIDARRDAETKRKAAYRKTGTGAGVPSGHGRLSQRDTRGTDTGVPRPESEPEPESEPDRRSPPPPTGGDGSSAVRVDDPAGMLAGRWVMGVRAVTGKPMARLRPAEVRDLHDAAAAHAPGLRGEDLLAWAESSARDFATASEARFGFTTRRFVAWLNADRPSATAVAKVGADGLVHPRARDGRPLQPYDPTAPYMRPPLSRGRVDRATNEDAAEILAAMTPNTGAAE